MENTYHNDDAICRSQRQPQAADLAGQQEHGDVARLEALHTRLQPAHIQSNAHITPSWPSSQRKDTSPYPTNTTMRFNTAKCVSEAARHTWARLALGGGRDGAVDAEEGDAARGQVGGDDVQHHARLAEQQRAVALADQARQQPPDELRLARRRRAWRAHMPLHDSPSKSASTECSSLLTLAKPMYALYENPAKEILSRFGNFQHFVEAETAVKVTTSNITMPGIS